MKRTLDYPPVWLAGALAVAAAQGYVAPMPAGPTLVAVGGLFVLAGLALLGTAALMLWRARTTIVPHKLPSVLVTSGPYRISRNPIYLGDLLILVGIAVRIDAWPSAVLLAPAFMWVITRRFIEPEEARLRARFETDFDAWAARVRRWI